MQFKALLDLINERTRDTEALNLLVDLERRIVDGKVRLTPTVMYRWGNALFVRWLASGGLVVALRGMDG